ncbi:MAG: amidohydrolase family protein [candidate division NC10 bacterium]|nr:amidohydrolase family protein [candidate division NC10 bacterium]
MGRPPNSEPPMKLLSARLLLPITSPPLFGGALLLQDGTILEIGEREELKRHHPSIPIEDLGDAVLLPGLVNVHTHLELSGLQGTLHGLFLDWLFQLIDRKRDLDSQFYLHSASQGVRDLIRGGTTSVGEITSAGMSFEVLRRSGLRGVVYYETLGLDPLQAEGIVRRAEQKIETMRQEAGGLLKVGLSPHAPYSLSERLLEHLSSLARRFRLPVAVHLAEAEEEVRYVKEGTGPIRERLLKMVGRDRPSHEIRGETPVELVHRHDLLSPSALAVHAVHLETEDVERLASSGVSVAHCPRSNHRLGNGIAPIPTYLERGIRVGLGTDSLASNDSLSLWDEMRFALKLHEGRISPEGLFKMATLAGAEALGLSKEAGSLEPGKRADLIAVRIHDLDEEDPYGSLLSSVQDGDVLLTMVDGKVLYRA